MKTLKDLARRGNRTVICTIHQPRTDIFQIFDNIVLMIAGGVSDYFSFWVVIIAYILIHNTLSS